eukprot:jgi/Undpi1/9716/HiC_scaffold_27.g12172.m1
MSVRVLPAKNILGRVVGRIAPQSCAAALRPGSETTARRPGCCITKQCQQQQQTRTFFSKERSKSVYEYGAHRSDAEAKIAEVPVVMVDGPVALCDGGGGALGHPLDYIYLASPDGGPRACQYCGIRFQMKQH